MEEDILNNDDVCEYCGDTGIIVEGEYDDHTEKKCICQQYDEDDNS